MNAAEYQDALRELDALAVLDGEAQRPRIQELACAIAEHEQGVMSGMHRDPIAAIRFRMEQQSLKPKDLVPFIGAPNRVYEVLSGKRKLSLRMIRRLHVGLGIPLRALLGEEK